MGSSLQQHYDAALKHPELEQRDIHEADEALAAAVQGEQHIEWRRMARAEEGAPVPHGGKVIADIRGMGKVFDWRKSPWTPVNGGKIPPLCGVQHIPVVRNVAGIGDFITLRDVLVAQGLMVQRSTDSEGNVALFTPNDLLCYQARGLNQQSWGCEHMHFSITEAWTKRQLRAAAWVIWHAKRNVGTPIGKGRLGAGDGVARVQKRGQVSHEDESNKAGFHDRVDPGQLFFEHHWDYVQRCVHFYAEHKHFEGA